jgi:hypothetical protein
MFLEMDSVLFQVAVPALTLMVSPVAADETHVLTEATSGVLVHEGLEPVQAAIAGLSKKNTPHSNKPKHMPVKTANFNLMRFFLFIAPSPW